MPLLLLTRLNILQGNLSLLYPYLNQVTDIFPDACTLINNGVSNYAMICYGALAIRPGSNTQSASVSSTHLLKSSTILKSLTLVRLDDGHP